MNNRLLVALATAGLLSVSVPTFAHCGVYVGGQLGWGHVDYSDLSDFRLVFDSDLLEDDSSNDGIAGRAYLGYQFNSYFGAEIGWGIFSDVNIPFTGLDLSTQQVDLLLKVGTPFGCSGFRGDIKFGIADVFWDLNHDASDTVIFESDNDSNINFALGASVSYSLSRQVSVDLSYLHVFGDHGDGFFLDLDSNRITNNGSPDTDLVTLGVSYTFM
ncbi:MAG: outer membrane beta-barrel protein [Pseudomonadota bacterium]|nr:outer membrane beta-barrel protein [Pseudomonadota bacterium]